MTPAEELVRGIAERVAATYGLEVVSVELRGGGKARTLRITLDRDPQNQHRVPGSEYREQGGSAQGGAAASQGGVTLDDCQNVSREVSTILDVEDVIPGGAYTLEVSSPGLDRKLVRPRDYERFTGSKVRVVTREPVNGQKHFEGRLAGFADGRLRVELPASKKKAKKSKDKAADEGLGARQDEAAAATVEIELSNVERANLAPEF
ncbi:MAG TPA: ribosome maturation factor RimP [Terriglobales bacterium]|nr:ribosome maturation factor RimP [Terriglobales bacterium]